MCLQIINLLHVYFHIHVSEDHSDEMSLFFIAYVLAFRCAYCYFLNPARKTRPQAPRLPEFAAETKMSQDPPAVAMETDLSSSPPAPGTRSPPEFT